MAASRIFYIILSLIVLVLAYNAERTDNPAFAKAVIVVLTLVAGLRAPSVGSDTVTYIKYFKWIRAGIPFDCDIGFIWLSKILLLVCHHPNFLLTIYAAMIYGPIIWRFWEMRRDTSFCIACFSFYTFFFFESMNVMRQFMSIAIVFYATRYIGNGNNGKAQYSRFFLSMLAAISLHFSSALGMIYIGVQYFFLRYLEDSEKRKLLMLLALALVGGSAVLAFVIVQIEQYMHYVSSVNSEGGLRVFALMVIWFSSFILYNPKDPRTGTVTKRERYFLGTTRVYYLISCILGMAGYFFAFMARLAYCFIPYQNVFFGVIVREWSEAQRVAIKLMVYAVIGYVWYQYVFLINGARQHPYLFFWQ